jgi:hypothetical protein
MNSELEQIKTHANAINAFLTDYSRDNNVPTGDMLYCLMCLIAFQYKGKLDSLKEFTDLLLTTAKEMQN